MIGFSALQRLLPRRVDAVPAFWNVEGAALRERGRPIDTFKVEDYGAPLYPEVVLITSRATLAARARTSGGVAAIADGMQDTIARPAPSRRSSAPRMRPTRRWRAQLRAVGPTLARGLRLNRAVLERWAAWTRRSGSSAAPGRRQGVRVRPRRRLTQGREARVRPVSSEDPRRDRASR